jgi:hypothetical protein
MAKHTAYTDRNLRQGFAWGSDANITLDKKVSLAIIENFRGGKMLRTNKYTIAFS